MKPVYICAKIISYVFSPLLTPFYSLVLAFFLTYLYSVSLSTRINALLVVAFLAIVLPALIIYGLKTLKLIQNVNLNKRSDRTFPYLATAACYLLALIYLRALHAPEWLLTYIIGGIACILINTAINLRWKISGHCAAAGCLVSMIFFIAFKGYNVYPIEGWIYGVIAVSGLVASSRLILHRHTLMQTAAGFLNGLACTSLTMYLIN